MELHIHRAQLFHRIRDLGLKAPVDALVRLQIQHQHVGRHLPLLGREQQMRRAFEFNRDLRKLFRQVFA